LDKYTDTIQEKSFDAVFLKMNSTTKPVSKLLMQPIMANRSLQAI